MKLIYDKTDGTWYIWDTVESNDGYTKYLIPTVVNDKAQMIAIADNKDEGIEFYAIIGDVSKTYTNIDRK
jgi:hypothetical protein